MSRLGLASQCVLETGWCLVSGRVCISWYVCAMYGEVMILFETFGRGSVWGETNTKILSPYHVHRLLGGKSNDRVGQGTEEDP